MEKIYNKFESAFTKTTINTEAANINLAGLALALAATGAIMSIINVLFG